MFTVSCACYWGYFLYISVNDVSMVSINGSLVWNMTIYIQSKYVPQNPKWSGASDVAS